MAFSESSLANMGTAIVGATAQRINLWVYKENATIATIKAAAYFANMVARGLLGEGDIVYVIASDGYYLGRFANVTNTLTIAISAIDYDLTA